MKVQKANQLRFPVGVLPVRSGVYMTNWALGGGWSFAWFDTSIQRWYLSSLTVEGAAKLRGLRSVNQRRKWIGLDRDMSRKAAS